MQKLFIRILIHWLESQWRLRWPNKQSSGDCQNTLAPAFSTNKFGHCLMGDIIHKYHDFDTVATACSCGEANLGGEPADVSGLVAP